MTDSDTKLIIRADANTRMGTGHVMRCIALGQAWQDAGGDVHFICCCDSKAIKARIVDEGFKLTELAQAYPESADDLETILQVAESTHARWIVTDGYHFNLEYQQAIRCAGLKLLCVDDYNHLPEYEADILLNQNIGAEEIDYRYNTACRKLLGTRYVLLRREFRTLEKTERNIPDIGTHLLVTLGGADPDNATLKVIRALNRSDIPGLQVKAIVGPSNRYIDLLQRFVSLSKINCELINSVSDMPGLMQWADFAISAAGSTCWELCALRVPFATVILANNQEKIAAGLAGCCSVVNLSWPCGDFQKRVSRLLEDIYGGHLDFGKIRRHLGSLVSVNGAEHIVKEMFTCHEN